MTDWKTADLSYVVSEFRRKNPDISLSSIDGQTMRAVLAGETVIVRVKGKNKYTLMSREDIESGKLELINKQIKEKNRQIRQDRRNKQDALYRAHPFLRELYAFSRELSRAAKRRTT